MLAVRARSWKRGVTLLDTLVGIFLMLVIFLGIAGAFELGLDTISNNKARAGGIALSNERMEYIRSLTYTSLGTVGGIPAGLIPQSETITLNGVIYTRRTVIEYTDDAKDGTGAADTNNIVEDYKTVKVDLSWFSRIGIRHIILVSRVSPTTGMETDQPGGALLINVTNAAGGRLSGARVTIVNGSTSPAVNLTTFTNASGTVTILGAPPASNYQIFVGNGGYSFAQTYSTSVQNTNPSPANLTVNDNVTTSATFSIDVFGSRSINTYTQILPGTWTDAFVDSTKTSTTTNIDIAAGVARLSGSAPYASPGHLQSITLVPSLLASWQTLSITDAKSASTSIVYHVYDGTGSILIPDGQLPNNSAGFSSTSVDLSGISTSTYPTLRIDATLSTIDSSYTPTIDAWSVAYTHGPDPLPNIAFTMRGNKTIGSGPGGTLYKFNQNFSTNGAGTYATSTMEWDTYLITIAGTTTGYDIASSCNPQPESLLPGSSLATNLYLAAHTVNSLLIDVRSVATGSLIKNATVNLSRSGFSATSTTDTCGQAFFSGLTSASNYTTTITASGYAPYTGTNVNVSGTSQLSVTMN